MPHGTIVSIITLGIVQGMVFEVLPWISPKPDGSGGGGPQVALRMEDAVLNPDFTGPPPDLTAAEVAVVLATANIVESSSEPQEAQVVEFEKMVSAAAEAMDNMCPVRKCNLGLNTTTSRRSQTTIPPPPPLHHRTTAPPRHPAITDGGG